MFQETYQHGAVLCRGQEEVRGRVWKENLGTQNLGHASLFQPQEKNGKWYPEPLEMLWRNESTLSTQYWKTWLQS